MCVFVSYWLMIVSFGVSMCLHVHCCVCLCSVVSSCVIMYVVCTVCVLSVYVPCLYAHVCMSAYVYLFILLQSSVPVHCGMSVCYDAWITEEGRTLS